MNLTRMILFLIKANLEYIKKEIMLDPKKLERLARYLHESVPKVIHDFTYDLDIKIRKILQNQISYMNFINRDEFDLQTQILFKTQEKIKQLETRLKILESIYKNTLNTDQSKHNLDE